MGELDPVLEIRQLTKAYGDKSVLKGIDLVVYPGEIIGYIGPNGAGKSTTVKILLGLVGGYGGDFSFFGNRIGEKDHEYKSRIGYVPESAAVYESLTAREYLTFVGRLYGLTEEEADHRGEAMGQLFGLAEAYDNRLSGFSKGMRQKVLWIGALMHNPDLLFLDEPLSGMDANSVLIIKDLMHGLAKRGKTIFYSSHIMDVVEKLSDRIVLIHDGVIAADGSFAQIQEQQGKRSLEMLFGEITGFQNAPQIAEGLIQIIEDTGADDAHPTT